MIDLTNQIKPVSEFNAEAPDPGVYQIPNEVYHAAPGLSASRIKQAAKSIAHFRLGGMAETSSIRKGTVLHAAALEPELFARYYAEAPDAPGNTKEGVRAQAEYLGRFIDDGGRSAEALADQSLSMGELRLVRDQIKEACAAQGIVLLTPQERADLAGMRASINSHPQAPKLIRGGLAELSFFGQYRIDGDTSILAKVRPDYLLPLPTGQWAIVSVKTTADASPAGFERQIYNMGYHTAEAFYTEFLRQFGLDVAMTIFLAVENRAPYVCEVYDLSYGAIEIGAAAAGKAIEKILAHKTGDYTGYTDGQIQEIGLPRWAYNQEA